MVYNWSFISRFESFSPSVCRLCQSRYSPETSSVYQDLCFDCSRSLPLRSLASLCYRCALPLKSADLGFGSTLVDKTICGACVSKQPPQYRSFAPLVYAFPVPEMISGLKLSNQFTYVGVLTEIFAGGVSKAYSKDRLPEYIVPVPLHRNKSFRRGFNQSEILADKIGKHLNIPILTNLTYRQFNTASQGQLNYAERQKNIKGAFQLYKHSPPLPAHVAVFDDVVTSGATTQYLAKLLRQGGCQRVDVWSIARTPKPD